MDKKGIYLTRLFSISNFHLAYAIPVPIMLSIIIYYLIRDISHQDFIDKVLFVAIGFMVCLAISYMLLIGYNIITQNRSLDNQFFLKKFHHYRLTYIKFDSLSNELLFIFKHRLNWIVPQAIISITITAELIDCLEELFDHMNEISAPIINDVNYSSNPLYLLLREYIKNRPEILNSIKYSRNNKNILTPVILKEIDYRYSHK